MSNPESGLVKREEHEWLETWLPQLCAELEALRPDELIPVNIDVPSAVTIVFGTLPKLRLLRERVAALPEFNLAAFDRLELYAQALHKVHAHFRMTVEPADDLDELVQRGITLRAQLLAAAQSLVLHRLLPRDPIQNLKIRPGYSALAST